MGSGSGSTWGGPSEAAGGEGSGAGPGGAGSRRLGAPEASPIGAPRLAGGRAGSDRVWDWAFATGRPGWTRATLAAPTRLSRGLGTPTTAPPTRPLGPGFDHCQRD